MNKKFLFTTLGCIALGVSAIAQNFTSGNLVVLQTVGATSKAGSQAVLKEYTTSGTAGITVNIPITGITPFQTGGAFGGSEGFLTTSTDNKFLVLGGYATTGTYSDITGTTATSVPRAVGLVYPSGYYLQVDTSTTFYSANDIRGGISDGTNFWVSGAANNNIDGVNYFAPGTDAAIATHASNPAKAYGLRIFNGQIYYSTQKAGPANSSSQLGVFALGTGLPTSGATTVPTQIINTGSNIPQDFSFNAAGDICYVAISSNNAAGGVQKWTKNGSTWTLAYTLGTGTTNIGAYGLVVDYSGANPVLYATTTESTGNRVIKITDNGSSSTATTLVPITTNTYYKGISFAPVASGTPLVNLAISTDTASEAGATVVTVSANTSAVVATAQTVTVGVSGTGITTGDYTLSNTTITIPANASTGSVTFTIKDDILGEGTEVATLTMSNLSAGITAGMRTTQKITIADNDGNNHPTVSVNIDSTTNFIDAGLTSAPATPFKVSGVLNDPTDPASSIGIRFNIKDLETASSSLTVKVMSSNTTVVPIANVTMTGTDSLRTLKITPAAIGYSNITVRVNDGTDSTDYVISYAASAASGIPAKTIWHTGISDGSAAIALDSNYYIVADDELNLLNVYSRTASGLPLKSYEYTSSLSLPEPNKPEADIEAAARSIRSNKIYWLGSMSNGKAPFDNKPNRDRIFATTVTGTGTATTFTFAGYAALKTSLVAWGDTHGYGFTASTAAGVDSKLPSGFAAEGMVFGPDSTTLYVGLRAPLVPVTARKNALIVPIKNFETWFNNGTPSGTPTYGDPIELNLGGKGVRDITRLSNGTYIIVAGNVGGSPVTGALYKWSGKATDTAILISSPASDTLNMEGVVQMNDTGSLQVISDKGDDILYNDGTAAKDFSDLSYRKFRSDILTSLVLTMPTVDTGDNDTTTAVHSLNSNKGQVSIYPNPSYGVVNIHFNTAASEQYAIRITDINGRVVVVNNATSVVGNNTLTVQMATLPKGFYIVHITAQSMNYSQKLILE